MRARALITIALAAAVALAACSDDDDEPAAVESSAATAAPTAATAAGAETTSGATTPAGTTPPTAAATTGSTPAGSTPAGSAEATATNAPSAGDAVVAGEPFPESRCTANEAAGKITYLSGFDFAATASIIDVIMAKQQGYFDELCLDVELQPSFTTANYPILAAGDAQVASAGSFSEVVKYSDANDADLVAIAVDGRTAIDALIVKPDMAETLEDLAGTTIGVKGALPPSVAAMLAGAGLVEGQDYETVLLDGFDPLTHITLDGIVGFPGYKSNEPGQLERAGIPFDLFDPTEYGVPGSFGVLVTTRSFLDEHPIAVEDFLRASMRGLADAMADPEAATATALELVEANGNPNFLSPEGEAFRWQTDVELLRSTTPAGTGIGIPDPALLQTEVEAYAAVDLFGGGVPDISEHFAAGPISSVYDGDQVIWPG
jgi:NitT/TauT family transport system substrate-binding protein